MGNEEHLTQPQGAEEHFPRSATRRTFLKGAAAVAAAAGIGGLQRPLHAQDSAASGGPDGAIGPQTPRARAITAFDIKVDNAELQFNKPIPRHRTNGDEARFSRKIGNFHKGLPTINAFGEVDLDAYQSLIDALTSGEFADFEAIPLGGTARLVNPQARLAFDTEGVDDQQLVIPPAPGVASAERAAEAVELYWMALARDVPFTQYGLEPITQGAIADLNRVSAFDGVTPVNAQNLFRLGLGGPTFLDLIGPYISQFLLVPFSEGVIPIDHKIRTYRSLANGGRDFLTTEAEWLAAQQSNVTIDASAVTDPIFRHVRSGRDLGQYVHIDVLYQAPQEYLNAKSILVGAGGGAPGRGPERAPESDEPVCDLADPGWLSRVRGGLPGVHDRRNHAAGAAGRVVPKVVRASHPPPRGVRRARPFPADPRTLPLSASRHSDLPGLAARVRAKPHLLPSPSVSGGQSAAPLLRVGTCDDCGGVRHLVESLLR